MSEKQENPPESSEDTTVYAKASAINKADVAAADLSFLKETREDYSGFDSRIIIPPYHPNKLYNLALQNNVLLQCITAMEVNIDGTGFDIVHRNEEANEAGDENVKMDLKGFFDEPFPNLSMVTIRRRLRVDLETVGHAFLEVVRDPTGQISILQHISAKRIRLLKLSEDAQMEENGPS